MSLSKIVQAENTVPWSDLPLELTGLVLHCLPADTDRLRFAAVCRNWHFSSMQHDLYPPLPWLALPDGTFFSLPHSESFQFSDSLGYHSSSGEWLFFLREGTCSLMNPFSKVTLMLPNMLSVRSINEPVEIINGPVIGGFNMFAFLLMIFRISIWKVIVCSPVLVAAIFVIGGIHTVALCRPGAASWLVSALGNRWNIMEIMFYDGKLFVVTSRHLFSIDIGEDDDNGEPRVSRIELVIEGPLSWAMGQKIIELSLYLVESCGVLLLVRREARYKESYQSDANGVRMVLDVNFLVFEADITSSQWVEVKSVGDDMALFVSKGSSRAVCVSQYKPWGNHIFSLEDGTWDWFWKQMPWSCCVCDMRNGEFYSPPEAAWMGEKGTGTWLFPRF
ncbi:hypothetical protein ACP70R_050191 [Stipagrostis hirtigluma subsp. patula]